MAQPAHSSTRTEEGKHPTRTAKVIEIVGTSEHGFEDAIQNAIEDARTTTRNISGAEVENMSISLNDGEISEYRADLKVAFGIERTDQAR
jgi:flavin-binding protein dodecin